MRTPPPANLRRWDRPPQSRRLAGGNLDEEDGLATPTRDLRPDCTRGETPTQLARHRHEDWRRRHDDGVIEPDGVVRRRSIRWIANFFNVRPMTIHDGIVKARRLREILADASRQEEAAGI